MQKTVSLLIAILLALSCMGSALAEDTKEYRDEVYSFRYPASWSQGIASNGDIVLEIPGTGSGVLTFAIITDLFDFTGDPEADAPKIESLIAQYSEDVQRAAGKNTALNGKYKVIESGGMHGFRAYGTWLDGNRDLIMVVLTGNRHMVSFVLIGKQAIAAEQALINSVELLGTAPDNSTTGFLRWEGTRFAMDYPEHYGLMEMNGGVAFINPSDTNCIIMARTYNLDVEYDDAYAAAIAANALPKSTGVEPNPVMVQIGGRNAAVIEGSVSSGPMAFYAFGSGRTAMAVMFTGEEAVSMADAVIRSIEFK